MAYGDQLAAKSSQLGDLFARWWDAPVPVEPSPAVWYYRNKVELNFARKHYPEPPPRDFVKETVLGFKRRGAWYHTLDLEECRIACIELAGLIEAVRRWYQGCGLRAYDSRRGDGMLRHLVVREGKRTGQRMVVLVTAEGELDEEGFVETVRNSFPVSSIVRGINRLPADQAVTDELHLLWGEPTIAEELHIETIDGTRRLVFQISPFSFFQTNTLATERLYAAVRRWVAAARPCHLYDLYGGSGGIAFGCADLVERVTSVESWEPASRDGEHNAELNGIDNVTFVAEAVEKVLGRRKVERQAFEPDSAVVLDPPRSGLHPKALRRIVELAPPAILYVSCKPTVLAREMETFAQAYEIEALSAVDLFPHTPHVEAVAALKRV